MVAALLAAPDFRVLAAAAADAALEVRNYPSSDGLLASLTETFVVLVAVDAADRLGQSQAPVIGAVRQRLQTVPILAFCSVSAGSAAVVEAVKAGATDLIFRGTDDSGVVMRAAIRAARQRSVTRRIYERISPAVPLSLRPFLLYAISRAAADPSVAEAAKTLGVDRKTLRNRLRMAGKTTPARFINWVRVSIATGLLEESACTITHAALEAGFESQSGFRNMLKRYTRMSCEESRQQGALDRVTSMFVRELQGTRVRIIKADGGKNSPVEAGVAKVGTSSA